MSPSTYFTTVPLKVNNAWITRSWNRSFETKLVSVCTVQFRHPVHQNSFEDLRVLETEIGLRSPTSSEDLPWSLIIGHIIDTLKSVGITSCLKLYWKNRNKHSFTFLDKQFSKRIYCPFFYKWKTRYFSDFFSMSIKFQFINYSHCSIYLHLLNQF